MLIGAFHLVSGLSSGNHSAKQDRMVDGCAKKATSQGSPFQVRPDSRGGTGRRSTLARPICKVHTEQLIRISGEAGRSNTSTHQRVDVQLPLNKPTGGSDGASRGAMLKKASAGNTSLVHSIIAGRNYDEIHGKFVGNDAPRE